MATRERLRELIHHSGLSQAAIARRLHVHPMWVSNRLTGHSAILADDLVRLAEALEVDPCELLPTHSPLRSPVRPEPGQGPPRSVRPEPGDAPRPNAMQEAEAVERMVEDYERELARAHAGEPMEPEVERMFVHYLREYRRLTRAQIRAVLQLVVAMGADEE